MNIRLALSLAVAALVVSACAALDHDGRVAEGKARAAGADAQVWGQNDRGMMEKYVKTAYDDRAVAFKGATLNKYVSDFANPVPPQHRWIWSRSFCFITTSPTCRSIVR